MSKRRRDTATATRSTGTAVPSLKEFLARRSKPRPTDYRSVLLLEPDQVDHPDDIFPLEVLAWLSDLGFTLPHAKDTTLPVGHYANPTSEGTPDVAVVTSAALDGGGAAWKVHVHLSEATASSRGEAHETTLWFMEPDYDSYRAGLVLTHARRADHQPAAAPSLITGMPPGVLLDGPTEAIATCRPLNGVEAGEAFLDNLTSPSRMRSLVLVCLTLDDEPEVQHSPFGSAATTTAQEQAAAQTALRLGSGLLKAAYETHGETEFWAITADLADTMGVLLGSHTPKPGTARVYGPGYRLLSHEQRGHTRPSVPVITQAQLLSDSALTPLSAAIARTRSPLPDPVERMAAVLDRAEAHNEKAHADAAATQAIRTALRIPDRHALTPEVILAHLPTPASPQTTDERAQQAPQETKSAAVEDLLAAQQRIAQLEALLNQTTQVLDEVSLDLQVAEEERIAAAEEARLARLAAHHHYESPSVPSPAAQDQPSSAPRSMAEILDRLHAMTDDGLVFTGDPKIVEGLDALDSLGSVAATTWEALQALADYARAKRDHAFDGGLETYLASPPPGFHTIPARRFVPRESETTMTMYGEQRRLPVPTSVEASGFATMEAHIRLARLGISSPRLHLLDHTHVTGPTAAVYVGYIGPHLRTHGTN